VEYTVVFCCSAYCSRDSSTSKLTVKSFPCDACLFSILVISIHRLLAIILCKVSVLEYLFQILLDAQSY
jgi:hypothetical protein